jgi:hypothetical protein
MWVATLAGFYSTVQKPGQRHLTIRSRERQDLENLKTWIPKLQILESKSLADDYEFRATASHEEWATALAAMALLVNYSNFKSEVAENDPERASIYSRVWAVLAQSLGRGAKTQQKATSSEDEALWRESSYVTFGSRPTPMG